MASLPAPTGYCERLLPECCNPAPGSNLKRFVRRSIKRAKAQIAVVTIDKIDSDQSIEEFSTALEDKWKVGKKGTDRGILMLFVMNPRAGRIEVGYGLEGILNDAKVGDIGRTMSPAARANDYNTAISARRECGGAGNRRRCGSDFIADPDGTIAIMSSRSIRACPSELLAGGDRRQRGADHIDHPDQHRKCRMDLLPSHEHDGWGAVAADAGRGDGGGDGGGFGGFGGGSSGGGGASGDW